MANIFTGLGSSIGGFLWSGLGSVLTAIIVFLAIIFFFATVFLIMWYMSYNIRVKIYEPLGQMPLTEQEVLNLKEMRGEEAIAALKNKNIKFTYLQYKRTKGKFMTAKGIQYFATFRPLRKHPPVPLTLMYDDGVHMIRLSRDVFIPIPKPQTILSVDEVVSIEVDDDHQWKIWNNMMSDRVNNKYQDLDAQKKIAFYFISGIVAMVLLGGFILWLVYKSSMKGYDAAQKFTEWAEGITGDKPA